MNTVALVVPRFGEEVVGGSERLVLNYAKLLSRQYQVDVITSAALEYETWLSHYPLGKSEFANNIFVYRFPSESRWKSIMHTNSWRGYDIPHSGTDILQQNFNKEAIDKIKNVPRYNAEKFIVEQGPYSEDMFQFLTWNHNKYKKVIFTPYLYPTTYLGVDRVPRDKVLILMAAHHEPHIYFPCFQKYAAYKWLVYFKSEADMLNKALGTGNTKWDTIKPSVGEIKRAPDITEHNPNSVVFVGRASVGKGFDNVAKLVDKYRIKHPGTPLTLEVVGDIGDDVKSLIGGWKEWIHVHGVVNIEKRNRIIQRSLALINCSLLDSFGLVNLEAARLGTPVLLNAECPAFANLISQTKGAFLGFNTRDQNNKFVDNINLLRNPEMRRKHSKLLSNWANKEMSEDAAFKKLVEVIEK